MDNTAALARIGHSSFILHPSSLDLGGYGLSQLLGQGGFGEVWEARKPDGTQAALKFMPCAHPSAASDEIRSIQLVKQLRHPNLVQIEKVWCSPAPGAWGQGPGARDEWSGVRGQRSGVSSQQSVVSGHAPQSALLTTDHGLRTPDPGALTPDPSCFLIIAMELADGSLADLAQAYREEFQSTIPADYLCFLLIQAADAIDFLNSHRHLVRGRPVGVQHCDIKPTNLLVFGETVKLCDFGLTTTVTSSLKTRRRGGTPEYSPPEVLQGRVSEATDQFALAVTYCVLRSDKLPFPQLPEVYNHGYVRPAPDLTMLAEAEQPILKRALAPNPTDRWPNCRALMEELENVIS